MLPSSPSDSQPASLHVGVMTQTAGEVAGQQINTHSRQIHNTCTQKHTSSSTHTHRYTQRKLNELSYHVCVTPSPPGDHPPQDLNILAAAPIGPRFALNWTITKWTAEPRRDFPRHSLSPLHWAARRAAVTSVLLSSAAPGRKAHADA